LTGCAGSGILAFCRGAAALAGARGRDPNVPIPAEEHNSLAVAVLLLQSQPARPGALEFLFPIVIFFAIFYFLLILPTQRQRKRQKEMLGALKPGDKVITSGGIYGTIVGLRDDVVQLRIADQVRIEVARSAIAGLQSQKEEAAKS
jgi:preprotein translocase subunit YajC